MSKIDEHSNQPEEKKSGSSCATGFCPLLNPRFLAFLLPFASVFVLDYFGVWPFCGNSVCHVCTITKAAIAGLVGLVGVGVYSYIAKTRRNT